MPEEKEQSDLNITSPERMLNLFHRHSGASGDGNKILARYVQDLNKWKFIPPAEFDITDANVTLAQNTDFETVVFTDGASATSIVNIWVPTHKKSLSSIKIIYEDLSASSLNIRLAFTTRRARVGRSTTIDSLAEASYASVGTINNIQAVKVPKTAWDGLQQLNEHDIVGLTITRNGAAGADTYNADFRILGLLVEFT